MKNQTVKIDFDEWEFVEHYSAEAFSRSLELVDLDAGVVSPQCVSVDGLFLPDGRSVSCYPDCFYLRVSDEPKIDKAALVLAVKSAINRKRMQEGQDFLFEGVPEVVNYYTT